MSAISIVVPTYNRPELLERLLHSVSNQTFSDYEVIIIDDNSSDKRAYEDLISRFNYLLNITYVRNEQNRGASYSRNVGIKRSQGDLIALVDDDDEWLPKKLEKQVTRFKAGPETLGIVYTWTDAVDENGKVVYEYRSKVKGYAGREILEECFIPAPSVLVKKTSLLRAGLFDVSFPSCQDWDMWTRILLSGYECDYIDQVLTIYHKHNLHSIGSNLNAIDGYYRYYSKHLHNYLHLQLYDNLSGKLNWLLGICTERKEIVKTLNLLFKKSYVAFIRKMGKHAFNNNPYQK